MLVASKGEGQVEARAIGEPSPAGEWSLLRGVGAVHVSQVVTLHCTGRGGDVVSSQTYRRRRHHVTAPWLTFVTRQLSA